MFKFSVLFWISFFAALVWCASVSVGVSVSQSYHPMAAKGDLFNPLRQWAVALVFLFGVGMYVFWTTRRPLASRVYQIGTVVLVLISLTPFLPRIDSGYTQTYYLDEQRYEIPWQYSPSGGQDESGGERFRARVSLPDLSLRYGSLSQTVTVTKALEFRDEPRDEVCTVAGGSTRCEWQRGEYVYAVIGDAELISEDITEMMASVADLLDGFVVPRR